MLKYEKYCSYCLSRKSIMPDIVANHRHDVSKEKCKVQSEHVPSGANFSGEVNKTSWKKECLSWDLRRRWRLGRGPARGDRLCGDPEVGEHGTSFSLVSFITQGSFARLSLYITWSCRSTCVSAIGDYGLTPHPWLGVRATSPSVFHLKLSDKRQ